jgi:Uma2 family endonuclease
MADARLKEMSVEEFFDWCQLQDQRYELIDGVPVPLRAMSGASTAHDRIASNIIGTLFGQLRGSPCWAATSDTALRTSIKRVRRPDVTVECSPPESRTYEALNPVAAFEILSPSTENEDKFAKVPEYLRHPKLRTIVIVAPLKRAVIVYSRDASGQWDSDTYSDPDHHIDIAGTTARLSLADIFAGLPMSGAPPRANLMTES